MDDPDWRGGLARLAPRGLTFDLQVLPPQLAAAAELAGAYPDLTFVLDHAGYTTARTAELDVLWRAGLTTLAARPNVFVKAGDYSTMDPSMDPAGFRTFVQELVDVFGPRRVLFASNFPNEGRRIGFADLVGQFAGALAGLTKPDRTAVLSGNAAGIYFREERHV
jgi:predicted TIM-barrel fold metal-dependent hydrolase